MAKSKPKLMNQISAMERILGSKKQEIAENIKQEQNMAFEVVAEIEDNTGKAVFEKKDKYTQTAFYITAAQHRALKLRAIQSGNPREKDMSSIVRAALDAYLGL